MEALEMMRENKKFIVDMEEVGKDGSFLLKLYQSENPLVLSDVLPLIENMGLKVDYMGGPFELSPEDKAAKVYVHEFACRVAQKSTVPFKTAKLLFEEAFANICFAETESDLFNGLTLRLGLTWREVSLMRTLARYLRQLRVPYSQNTIGAALLEHPSTVRLLISLFAAKYDPDLKGDRARQMASLIEEISAELSTIQALEEDRILRRYLNLIQASLRTNYYQKDANGSPKPYLSIKFDSHAVDYMPLPKPFAEIFVYSPRVEAIHLRGGKVARGGIRWSDRRNDYRNEVLSLMKAQMVKNSVIVPVGSKGGFIVKHPPQEADRQQAEAIACYRLMMGGLLDITDNRVDGKIIPPKRVVRHDGDDPYLVVAADKGTAKFSDIANSISQEYGFWLDDAFASGGSAGFDHKNMGITARGAWEAVKRHFREIGKDIQATDFTCVGVGDMSGDVFGNAMLLSKHIRLVGAFDHRNIFCDPCPDAAASYAERSRLFKLPRSSWADYAAAKISKGGGVFSRSAKTIKLTPEIKKAFGITADILPPAELIQAMLRSKVDLLYFGGIGTYVKATRETHENVTDRGNDALRVNGCELQASVVGEGANLAMTQRGRVEYAQKGGRLNTDAIDNSAGVATSDHEVNIKILMRKLVTSGSLSLSARNKLLEGMTEDVGMLVLRDNYLQTQALTLAEAQAVELLPLHARSIRALEKTGLLNRTVEFLPDENEIAERQRLGKGMTRSEMAILLAYAKIWLYEQLLASDLPDDEYLRDDLVRYFPPSLQKKYADAMENHQLRREIVATGLTNDFVNRCGSHFVFIVGERTGADPAAIVRAFLLARAAFDLTGLWDATEKLDNRVAATAQTSLLLSAQRLIGAVVPYLLTTAKPVGKLVSAVELYQSGAERLAAWLAKAPAVLNGQCGQSEADLAAQGVPAALARRAAYMKYLASAPALTVLAAKAKCNFEEAAEVYFGLGQRLGLDLFREKAVVFGSGATMWQREAVATLLEDMEVSQRALSAGILAAKSQGKTDKIELWAAKNAAALERYEALLIECRAAATLDVAMLMLASRQLAALVR